MITPSITDLENWWADFLSAATGLAVGDVIRLGFQSNNIPAYSGDPLLSYAIYPSFGEWGDKDFSPVGGNKNEQQSFMTRRMNCSIATVGLNLDVRENIRGSLTGYQREKLTSKGIYPISHCEPPDRDPILYNGKWIDAYYLNIYFNVLSTFTEGVDVYEHFTIKSMVEGNDEPYNEENTDG